MKLISDIQKVVAIFILCSFVTFGLAGEDENEVDNSVSDQELGRMMTIIGGVGLRVNREQHFEFLSELLTKLSKRERLSLMANQNSILSHIIQLNSIESLLLLVEHMDKDNFPLSRKVCLRFKSVHFNYYSSILELLLESGKKKMLDEFVPKYSSEVFNRIKKGNHKRFNFKNWLYYLAYLKKKYSELVDYKKFFFFRTKNTFTDLGIDEIQIMISEIIRRDKEKKEEEQIASSSSIEPNLYKTLARHVTGVMETFIVGSEKLLAPSLLKSCTFTK